jgi:hypothetical protein
MRRLFRAVLPSVASIIFLCLCSAEAKADHIIPILVHNNPTSWNANVHSVTTTTFEGLAPANGSTTYPGGVTVGNVNVVATNGAAITAVDATAFGYSFSSGVALALPTSSVFRVNFLTPVSAAAFNAVYIVNGQPVGSDLRVIVYKPNGQSITLTTPTFFVASGVAGFQGYISDEISAIEITFIGSGFGGSGGTLLLDNIFIAQPRVMPTPISDLPEPATLLLLGAGLAGVAVKIRSGRKG